MRRLLDIKQVEVGKTPNWQNIHVYLDGVKLRYAIKADADLGTATVYLQDENNEFIGYPLTETVRGKIEFYMEETPIEHTEELEAALRDEVKLDEPQTKEEAIAIIAGNTIETRPNLKSKSRRN